jgi:hypothetical protein
MPVEGLEPPLRKELVPKTSVSTNFTTPAYLNFRPIKFVFQYKSKLKISLIFFEPKRLTK